MKFGLYSTNAHVTVGAPEIAQAIVEAKGPLPRTKTLGLRMTTTAAPIWR